MIGSKQQPVLTTFQNSGRQSKSFGTNQKNSAGKKIPFNGLFYLR